MTLFQLIRCFGFLLRSYIYLIKERIYLKFKYKISVAERDLDAFNKYLRLFAFSLIKAFRKNPRLFKSDHDDSFIIYSISVELENPEEK